LWAGIAGTVVASFHSNDGPLILQFLLDCVRIRLSWRMPSARLLPMFSWIPFIALAAWPLGATEFQPSEESAVKPAGEVPEGMVWIPGGEFSMGGPDASGGVCSADTVADARPVLRVKVDGFWMDKTEVTNASFARFVEATGYKTVAEIAPTKEEFPHAPPEMLVAGAVVFRPPPAEVALDNHLRWWSYVPGANWRHPEGPGSTIEGRGNHPVVHIAWKDAAAYAKWAGKRLATEAEWEFAARGGLSGKVYAWGDDFQPDGKTMANTWQGAFPGEGRGQGRIRRHRARGEFSRQRLRPPRHGRQCLGVGRGLVPGRRLPARCQGRGGGSRS
jgi:formylglycine-generating enzyme